MKSSALLAGLLMLVSAAAPSEAAEPGAAGSTNNAGTKIMRGASNTLTGWVEIPKRMHETWELSGPGTGLTWGLLRGIGHGFIRTAAGLYELVTFPFPAPPGYEPVLQPEYVFD